MENLLEKLIPNVMARLPDFFKAIGDTLVMVGWSGIIAFVFGLFFRHRCYGDETRRNLRKQDPLSDP